MSIEGSRTRRSSTREAPRSALDDPDHRIPAHRGGGPPIIEGSQSLPRAGGIPRRRRFVHASRRGETIQGSTAGDPFRASVEDRKSTRLNSSHLVISYAV